MPVYTLRKEQFIRAPLEKVWEFISSPANLKKITPPHMGFDIITPNLPTEMYPGMIIQYNVKPLAGIKTTWVTEITHVVPMKYFVDEQRVGPYQMWHHQHILIPQNEGVLMKDIIDYQPPLGPLGAIINNLLIEKELENIFHFRSERLKEIFP